VSHAEVLQVERVRADHVPRRVDLEVERLGGQQLVRRQAVVERHREPRRLRVVEQHMAGEFDRRIDRLACERGNLAAVDAGGDARATAVAGKLPRVQRAAERSGGRDTAAREVRTHVRAPRGERVDCTGAVSKCGVRRTVQV
jgi:hypothetical protein